MQQRLELLLCYDARDLRVASDLVDALEKRGYSVRWDRSLPPSTSLADGQEGTFGVIVLWSASARASEVLNAAQHALSGARRLYIVSIDEADLPHAYVQDWFADLRRWDGSETDRGVSNLVKTLEDRLEAMHRECYRTFHQGIDRDITVLRPLRFRSPSPSQKHD